MFEEMRIRTFLLAFLGVTFLIAFFFGPIPDEHLFEVIFSYTVVGLFPIAWIRFQLEKQYHDMSQVIYTYGVKKYTPHVVGIFVVLFLFSLGAVWLNSFLLSLAFPTYVESFLQEDILPKGRPVLFFFMIVYISFLGPIVEELVFRGLLLKRLAYKFGLKTSIFVTNGLFAILHFDLIGAFIFGVIISLLYLHTENLLIPIIVHVANNFFAIMLSVFNIPLPRFFSYETVADIQAAALPNIILLVIMTPILIFVVKRSLANDYLR